MMMGAAIPSIDRRGGECVGCVTASRRRRGGACVRLVGREARWIRGVEGVGVAARGRGIHRRGWSRKRRRA